MAHTDVLPFAVPLSSRPEPELTIVRRSRNAGGWVSAVARGWAPGQTYCGLCPLKACNLTDGQCLVQAQTYVSDAEAPTFSLADFLGRAAVPAADHRAAVVGLGAAPGDEPGQR